MKQNSDPRVSTVDNDGVPYGVRLKRARESGGKFPQEVAALLGFPLPSYYDLENCEGELNMVITLGELSKLSSILGIHSRIIFDDKNDDGQSLPPEKLCAKIKAFLHATDTSVADFEDRVGFVIAPSLGDSTEVLKWNVDCLRSVCAEIGVDWRLALP